MKELKNETEEKEKMEKKNRMKRIRRRRRRRRRKRTAIDPMGKNTNRKINFNTVIIFQRPHSH